MRRVVVKTEKPTDSYHGYPMGPRSMDSVIAELERRGIDLARPFTCRIDPAMNALEAEQEETP